MRQPASTASFRMFLALSTVCIALAANAAAQTGDAATKIDSSPAASQKTDPQSAGVDALRPPEGPNRTPVTRPAPAVSKPRDAPVTDLWKGIEIVVYKSKRLLAVYRDGNFEKEFRVVLGMVPEGRKRFASDARTPEGLYHVTANRRHAKWQHFLALDYPNAEDRRRYAAETARGKIPELGGKPFEIGGDIGIHGNDRDADQAAGVDWTQGCIALAAADIEDVAAMVPVRTPVWIVE